MLTSRLWLTAVPSSAGCMLSCKQQARLRAAAAAAAARSLVAGEFAVHQAGPLLGQGSSRTWGTVIALSQQGELVHCVDGYGVWRPPGSDSTHALLTYHSLSLSVGGARQRGLEIGAGWRIWPTLHSYMYVGLVPVIKYPAAAAPA